MSDITEKKSWQFAPQDEIIASMRGLLQIDSTSGSAGAVTPEAPLGKGINEAINYMLDLGQSFGFRVKNVDGYCGWIEMGDPDAEEMLGIVAHVDTVPVGEGWSHPPFDATVEDGKIYGRGTNDDKGPAVAALYAMKAVADAGVPLGRRVRLILGGDEESGRWACLKRYKETEEIPTCAFSPDADYPVIFAEKGILNLKISAENLSGDPLTLESGTVVNIVPEKAKAHAGGKDYAETGVPAHAMAPEKGENALLKLGERLREDGIKHPFVELLNIANAEDLGIAFSDADSGPLTFNPAIAHVGDDGAVLECDIRYPVTMTAEPIVEAVRKAVGPLGFGVEKTKDMTPLYVDKNSELVQNLVDVYRNATGDDAEPLALGGGTYARAFDNAVAFGILFPGEPNMCHQKDEYWPVADLEKNLNIFADAITALAGTGEDDER